MLYGALGTQATLLTRRQLGADVRRGVHSTFGQKERMVPDSSARAAWVSAVGAGGGSSRIETNVPSASSRQTPAQGGHNRTPEGVERPQAAHRGAGGNAMTLLTQYLGTAPEGCTAACSTALVGIFASTERHTKSVYQSFPRVSPE